MSENRYITDETRSTLERDERLPHPAEVAVSERHGTVTLRGSVGTFHQRRAAVRIARSVHGVVASTTNSGSTRGIAGETTRSAVQPYRR